jgi:hypothetical protein
MVPGGDKLDDLNAIDEAWAELPTKRPSTPDLPKVNKAEGGDPEIDAMIAGLDLLDDETPSSPPPPPKAPPPPPPEATKTPSKSLMPPYSPPVRPPSKGATAVVPVPERPKRSPSGGAIATPASSRTLLAFGAPSAGGPGVKTPPALVSPATPSVRRDAVPTPIVQVLDAQTGEVTPALTLDLDELDAPTPPVPGAGPIRKPSAPRVPIDLSEFESSFDAAVAGSEDGVDPLAGLELELPVTPGPPAVPETRRSAPTPDEVITTPLPLEEAIGFERELDLPTSPGVAKDFDLDEGDLDALGAVERAGEEEESTVARLERDMRDRFDAGDFTAALESAEFLLRDVPGHEGAKRYAASCREVLLQMYAARLGSLDRVPSIVIGGADLKNLGLDHRAGFVLSCIDGQTSFADILDLSGMPPLESYRILCDLILAHVIAVR